MRRWIHPWLLIIGTMAVLASAALAGPRQQEAVLIGSGAALGSMLTNQVNEINYGSDKLTVLSVRSNCVRFRLNFVQGESCSDKNEWKIRYGDLTLLKVRVSLSPDGPCYKSVTQSDYEGLQTNKTIRLCPDGGNRWKVYE